jgi:hypothetical protein
VFAGAHGAALCCCRFFALEKHQKWNFYEKNHHLLIKLIAINNSIRYIALFNILD